MSLLNVRLGEADARLARQLKERGVSISEIVRTAIRERAALAVVPQDTDSVLDEMSERFPLEGPPSKLDTTDRRSIQRHIRRKLRKK